MSLETQATRVAQGTKDTLKALINMLGGTITDELIDQYPAIAAALLPPTGLTGNTVTVTAKEAIDAGNMIAIFTNDKTYDAYKATNEALPQTNFYLGVAKEAIESGATAQVISIAYLDNSASYVLEQNKQKQQKFWVGTKAEYDAVSEKDPETLYVITDESGAAQGYVTKEEYQALVASADGKAPKSHAAQHAADGADPIAIATSQVTGLDAALANKAEKSRVDAIDTALDGKMPAPVFVNVSDLNAYEIPGFYACSTSAGTAKNFPPLLSYAFALTVDKHGGWLGQPLQTFVNFADLRTFKRSKIYDANNWVWTDWVETATTSQLCNPNLLDNWYFVGGSGPGQFPVNQRGQTHYDVTGGSTIDRWALTGTGGSMDVQDDGVLLTSPGQYATYFTYKIPSEIVSNLAGKQICLSALWGDDTGYGGSLNIYFDDKWSNYVEITANDLNSRVLTVPDGVKSIYINFGANGAGTCKIKAAKLELGSHQTLAHKEGGKWVLNEIPDYAEQLARCQRYAYIPALETFSTFYAATINPTTGDIFFPIIVPSPMRAVPAVTANSGALYVGPDQKNVPASAITCYAIRGNQVLCRANGVAVGASARSGLIEIGGLQLIADL